MNTAYQIWSFYGEFAVLGVWGVIMALARRILFGGVCRDAALGSGGKGRMQKAMTLKFEKSCELRVGIYDRDSFVRKYLCQERKLGIPLSRWRRLPERWAQLILCAGVGESAGLLLAGYGSPAAAGRLLASAAAASAVWASALLMESESLWEKAHILLLDYVSNTLYPRQIHVYEGFEAPGAAPAGQAGAQTGTGEADRAGTQAGNAGGQGSGRAAVSAGQAAAMRDLQSGAAASAQAAQTSATGAPYAHGCASAALHVAAGPASLAAPEKVRIALEKDEEKIFQEVLSDFLGTSP